MSAEMVGGVAVFSPPPGLDFDDGVKAAAREAAEERIRARVEGITAEWERAMAERRVRDSGVQRAHADGEPEGAGRVFAELQSSKGRGAFIHGPTGTGKTFMASALVRRWNAWRPGEARLLSEVVWFEMLRSCFDGRGDSDEVMSMACRPQLLVLDDLGKTHPTDWTVETLFRVVDWRWSRGLATSATSNYGLAELGLRLAGEDGRWAETAQAVCSRLAGSCVDVPLVGGDRRCS